MKKLIATALILLLSACAAVPMPSPDTGATPPPSLEIPTVSSRPARDEEPEHTPVYGTREVRWLIPVMMNKDDYKKTRERIDAMTSLINMELLPYELSLWIDIRNVTLTKIPWPDEPAYTKSFAYSVTKDMMDILTSGETYDMISVPTAHVPLSKLIDAGLLRSLSGDLARYENIANVLLPAQLDAIRYGGGIYGVPAGFDLQDNIAQAYLGINAEIAAQIGVDDTFTLDELFGATRKADSMELPSDMYFNFTPDVYRREYDEFPFKVSEDLMFLYTADGGVESYVDSSVARQDFLLSKRIWDVNSKAGSLITTLGYIGYTDVMMREETFGFANLLSATGGTFENTLPILLAPEKPRILYGNPNGKMVNVIPAYAQAYGLELLDIIYGNPDIYALFGDEAHLLGYSDGTLLIEEDTPVTSARNSGVGSSGIPIYRNDERFYFYNLFDCVRQSALTPKFDASAYEAVIANTDYAPMPWDGFTFDASPVESLYTTVNKRLWGYWDDPSIFGSGKKINALPYLFVAPKTVEDDLINIASNVQAGGMDALLEECRRQYAQFLQNKGREAPAP